tara:strand:+ start:135 stop:380 length:246 start_codon:yes stop_codon:yes gene_type:complete
MIVFPQKLFFGLLAISFTTVSIQLIPLSKQASSWNRCLKKTSESLSQIMAIKKMDKESKEVISVMICNGAVFEPKIKKNIQ